MHSLHVQLLRGRGAASFESLSVENIGNSYVFMIILLLIMSKETKDNDFHLIYNDFTRGVPQARCGAIDPEGDRHREAWDRVFVVIVSILYFKQSLSSFQSF
jgi:hypothetical protein